MNTGFGRRAALAIAIRRTSGSLCWSKDCKISRMPGADTIPSARAASTPSSTFPELRRWLIHSGVIAPAASDDQLFFEDGARIFPEFLKLILADYKIQDNKFHVAGPSNGGIAAFHVAAANPQYFLSVTAFPGYMWEPSAAKLQAISKMCVFMYVGENDEYMWHPEMKKEAEWLRSRGTVAHYTVEKGQPHRMETLAGANAGRIFDGFEETKKGCSK